SSRQCLSVRKTLNRSSVISDIYARTYRNGGYEMPLVNPSAHRLGIHRKRYVNSVDSKSRTVLSAKELLQKSNRQYEQWELEYSGCILCERGAKLILDGKDQHLRVRELHYYFDQNGEKTKIFAEVREK
ncbi:MAG: hypothetical protein II711_04270, partial [Clostridia bacterium]|nr:hypothetical protein [Clostridia bacterium]